MSAPADVEMVSVRVDPTAVPAEAAAAGDAAAGDAAAGDAAAGDAAAGDAAAGEAAAAEDAAAAGDAPAGEAPAEAVPAEQVPFAQLCDVLERIHKKKKDKQEQDKILTSFFDELRLNAAEITGRKNCTLFPIMRLLLPALDRERSAYNLKETKLGSLLVKVLSLSPTSGDGRRLAGYRAVGNAPESDFAGVAYFVLKNRLPPAPGDLTVKDVNDVLDKIATAQVGGKGPILDEAFSHLLRHLSAEQLKWFLRVVLKDLRLGAGAPRVLAAAHPDAPEYYESCANLLQTCSELEAGATRPLELGVQLFAAVSPMLAERLDVTRVPRLPPAHYCLEDKFDGERFQLHMRDGVFEYFSRRGHSYGAHFGRGYGAGAGAGAGLLTPRLRGCFAADVCSIILDGEMMGWHKQRQAFGSKGMSYDVKKITSKSSFQPCFCVFDILHYNGRNLAGAGGAVLRERGALLDAVVRDVPGAIVRSIRRPVEDSAGVLRALNAAMEEQQEGVVVKDLDSHYLANRRNAGWYKVKPEYTEGTMVELDLAVIGAARAAGGRGARSFLVACRDDAGAGAGAAARWVCVGRVGGGLAHAQRERLAARLAPHWRERAAAPPPAALVFHKEKPDFWLPPEHSIILQVRATELVRSTEVGTSHTLRFPRVTAVRADKPVQDAMTLAEFDALVKDKGPVVKLSTHSVPAAALAPGAGPARRKRGARALTVPDHLRARPRLDDVQVEAVSAALAGRELCVLSGDDELRRRELVRAVQAHGGTHVENVGPNTWCCVAGKRVFRVSSVLAARDVDVVSAAWLRALPPAAARAEPEPRHMLHVSSATRLRLCRRFDRFGDGYVEPTDEERLRGCFARLDEEPELVLTRREMLAMDRRLFGDQHPFSFLRDTALYFPSAQCARAIAARMRGAQIVSLDDPALTHQVLPAGAAAARGLAVSERWLDACLLHSQYLSEKPFLL